MVHGLQLRIDMRGSNSSFGSSCVGGGGVESIHVLQRGVPAQHSDGQLLWSYAANILSWPITRRLMKGRHAIAADLYYYYYYFLCSEINSVR